MNTRSRLRGRMRRVAAPVAAAALMGAVLTGSDAASGVTASTVAVIASSTSVQTAPASALEAAPVTARGGSVTLVLLVASDGPTTGGQSVSSVTGCGLAWTPVKRANASLGVSEAWSANAPAGISSCAPRATLTKGGYQGTTALIAVRGGVIGTSAAASARSGAARAPLTLPAGSIAFGVGNDWDRATVRTLLPRQQSIRHYLSSLDDAMWTQRLAGTSNAGTVTIGTSAPTNHQWNFVAVAVAPASAVAPAPAPTVTATRTPTSTPMATATSTATPTATPTPTRTAAPTPTRTVTPTPTPTRTSSSTATAVGSTPVSTSKPGASNTGVPAGVTLTPSGSLDITTANQVISGLDISGAVTVDAPGVVIKSSRIHGTDSNGIDVRSGNLTIYDSEIYGFENAIAYSDWKAVRVNIHSTYGDGVKLGSNVTLQDSWIHDLIPAAGAHSDGGQMQDGIRNLVVQHNVIDVSSAPTANSALFLAPDFGPSTDGPVTIDSNWLDGGNYTLFCVDGNNGQYIVKNITITNNKFGRGAKYGSADVNVPITESGNDWADTGAGLTL